MECGARTFVGGVAQHSLGGGALLDCYLDVIVCNELITTESVVGHRLNVAGMNERRFGNKETDRQTDRQIERERERERVGKGGRESGRRSESLLSKHE